MSGLTSSFEPVVPHGAVCIEHIRLRNNTTDALAHVAARQWMEDSANQRDTWLIVGSDVEWRLVTNELLKERVPYGRLQVGPPSAGAQEGTGFFRLMTYREMQPVVTARCAVGWTLPEEWSGDTTIMLNLGWGNTTYDRALVYAGLSMMLRADAGTAVLLCTVEDDTAGWSGRDASRLSRVQVIEVSGGYRPAPSITWHDETEPRAAVRRCVEDAESRRGAEHRRGRCAVVMSQHSLARAMGRDEDDIEPECIRLHPDEVIDVTRMRTHEDELFINVHEDVMYVGPIYHLDLVLISRGRMGWALDDRTSHAVLDCDVPRSRAEILHASRLRGYGSGPPPPVHCFMRRADFDRLPWRGQPSCHLADLAKLLLAYVYVGKPAARLAELPVELPASTYVTEEFLRRLRHKGLLRVLSPPRHGGVTPHLHLLHSALALTGRGALAAELTMKNVTESLHAACLACQVLGGGAGPLPDSPAVRDAVTSLVVILETNEQQTWIAEVVAEVAEAHRSQDFSEEFRGVAADLYCRGPTWFAVAVWHRMRRDRNWRAKTEQEYARLDQGAEATVVDVGGVSLVPRQSFRWDDVVQRLNAWSGSNLAVGVAHGRLADEELLAVDKALVTAFADKLAYVLMPRAAGAPFAYDLVSQRELSPYLEDQHRLLDVERCWQYERERYGAEAHGFFCFYTHLERKTLGGTGGGDRWAAVERAAVDLTFVASRAVREVLGEVEDENPAGELGPVDKIRTRIRLSV